MIRSLTAVFLGLAAPLAVQAYALSVTYGDGTRLTIETASTAGNAQASYHGDVSSEGRIWHRLVRNKQGAVIFAYDLDASQGTVAGAFHVRILPAAGSAPTVSAVRDLQVRQSESVKIDILYNPATGEKIYDVLQPSFALSAAGEGFRFEDFQVEIDGQTFSNHNGAILTGVAARILREGGDPVRASSGDQAGIPGGLGLSRPFLQEFQSGRRRIRDYGRCRGMADRQTGLKGVKFPFGWWKNRHPAGYVNQKQRTMSGEVN